MTGRAREREEDGRRKMQEPGEKKGQGDFAPGGWPQRSGSVAVHPTDVYGGPIFSFDYSTRANAPGLSRQLHLTVGRGLKFRERE